MSLIDQMEQPERSDFRRRGKGTPLVMNKETGKFVAYRRSSSVGKILDDETGLTDWKIRTTVEGCAQRPDLMAQVSTLDHDADKKAIRDIAEDCLVAGKGTQRQVTGTAIHRMLDHVDLQTDWVPAPHYAKTIDAYRAMLELWGLVPIDVEVHCVNDQNRLAGTADRRYRLSKTLVAPTGETLPIGTVVIGDTKTGQSLEYASGTYATQLAAYATSLRYDVATDERTEFDPPNNQDWAIIVHVDAADSRVDVYWCDLRAGCEGIALGERVREWRRRGDLITPAKAPLVAVAAPANDEAASRARHPSAQSTVERPVPPDPLPDVRQWLRGRVGVVRACGTDATNALLRAWPHGVPGLKFDNQSAEQLDMISEALWLVEREYALPFPPSDPRTPEHVNRYNEHPRQALMDSWIGTHGLPDPVVDAIRQFASLSANEWPDADLTEMFDGTLRAMGYEGGIQDVGQCLGSDAPIILSSAFAITTNSAMLLYQADGKPVVRTITKGITE